MHNTWIVARHEYLSSVRRAGFLALTLLIPALSLAALLLTSVFSGAISRYVAVQVLPTATAAMPATPRATVAATGPGTPTPPRFNPNVPLIGIVDLALVVTPIPADFAPQFRAFSDEGAARHALQEGQIGSLFIIPADYIASGQVTGYVIGAVGSTLLDQDQALRVLLADGLRRRAGSPALVVRAAAPLELTAITLAADPAARTRLILALIIAALLVLTIMVSSGYLRLSMSEEQSSRLVEVLLSSVTATDLLAGKVLGYGVLGLTQIGIWLISALALGGTARTLLADAAGSFDSALLLLLALFFLLGYLLYGTINVVGGALSRTPAASAQGLSWTLIVIVLPLLVALPLLVDPAGTPGQLNSPLARLLSFFPFSAPTMMALRLSLGGVSAGDIAGSIAVLVLTIALILGFGARRFRANLLGVRRPVFRPGVRHALAGAVALALVLVVSGAAYERAAEADDLRRYPPPGRLINVGGYRMHIHCTGAGSPTVVLEADAGMGDAALSWSAIQPRLAANTRVCAYDRAGRGWSDPGPAPRNVTQLMGELHTLLARAGIDGPFVLAGHAFGGALALAYAARYPGEVAGMVLVDSERPEQMPPTEVRTLLEAQDSAFRERTGLLRLMMRLGLVRLVAPAPPPGSDPAAYALNLRPQAIDALLDERAARQSFAEARLPGDLRSLPLRVIVPGEPAPAELPANTRTLLYLNSRAQQAELARLSTNGRLVVAEGSGERLLLDQREVVTQAILEVVAATR